MILYFIGICILLSVLWIGFEMWKAPLLDKKSDGRWVTIQKEKKIMDFFKKKNKNE